MRQAKGGCTADGREEPELAGFLFFYFFGRRRGRLACGLGARLKGRGDGVADSLFFFIVMHRLHGRKRKFCSVFGER